MAALLQITEQDIQDVLGNQEAGEQLQNNISGIAVELIQNKLDMQTFIYISNMAKAIKRSGQIWLSMGKDILVEQGRKMKTLDEQGEASNIELLRPMVSEETGEQYNENDLSSVDLDVSVEVGPTSSSKRAATVRGLTGMMQITQDPETLQVLGAMAMMNMEGEGISNVRDYFRKKLLRMGVVKPTDHEAQELQAEAQNQQPDPQVQFLEASAAQAEAEAIKARASTVLTAAQADKAKADTMKILSDIDINKQKHVVELVQSLQTPQPDSTGMQTPQ
jgi:hypothetical protein